jgi:hypothetical protein
MKLGILGPFPPLDIVSYAFRRRRRFKLRRDLGPVFEAILMNEDTEIWVIAPRGFRPSNWVDMLRDFDVAYNLDPFLVDPGFVEHPGGHREEILVIRLELLEQQADAQEFQLRHDLFWEMLERVGSLGLTVSFPERMAREHPEAWAKAVDYCGQNAIKYANRQTNPLVDSSA